MGEYQTAGPQYLQDESAPARGQLVNRASLAEQAYHAIKGMILRFELKPGEPITEAKLSVILDISKSPIRTALQNLHHDGLVTITPYKETIVTEISVEQVQGIYEARSLIEPHALTSLTPHLANVDYEQLEAILARSERALNSQDFPTFFRINSEFHGFFIRRHGNPIFWDMFRTIDSHMERLRMVSSIITNNPNKQLDEHRAILKIVESKDASAAGKALKDHILGYYDDLLAEIERGLFTPFRQLNGDAVR